MKLIIIAPLMTHKMDLNIVGDRRTIPTGNAAEVAEFIPLAIAAGFHVVDARVFAGEEHIAGGFLVDY